MAEKGGRRMRYKVTFENEPEVNGSTVSYPPGMEGCLRTLQEQLEVAEGRTTPTVITVEVLPEGGAAPAGPDRLALLAEVYAAVYEGCESFERDEVGADLAYLLGAIARGSSCEWPEGRPLVLLLRAAFPDGHPVWGFVSTEE
jgi:hypothetical protein